MAMVNMTNITIANIIANNNHFDKVIKEINRKEFEIESSNGLLNGFVRKQPLTLSNNWKEAAYQLAEMLDVNIDKNSLVSVEEQIKAYAYALTIGVADLDSIRFAQNYDRSHDSCYQYDSRIQNILLKHAHNVDSGLGYDLESILEGMCPTLPWDERIDCIMAISELKPEWLEYPVWEIAEITTMLSDMVYKTVSGHFRYDNLEYCIRNLKKVYKKEVVLANNMAVYNIVDELNEFKESDELARERLAIEVVNYCTFHERKVICGMEICQINQYTDLFDRFLTVTRKGFEEIKRIIGDARWILKEFDLYDEMFEYFKDIAGMRDPETYPDYEEISSYIKDKYRRLPQCMWQICSIQSKMFGCCKDEPYKGFNVNNFKAWGINRLSKLKDVEAALYNLDPKLGSDIALFAMEEGQETYDWFVSHRDTNKELLKEIMKAWDSRILTMKLEEAIAFISMDKYEREARRVESRCNISLRDMKTDIKATTTVEGGIKAELLAPDDAKQTYLGYLTHCCQHLGAVGATAMMYGLVQDNAGFVDFTSTKSGKTVAQAEVWVSKDTFVFDNIEFADFRNISDIKDVLKAFVSKLPYKNVVMGTGYDDGASEAWGLITKSLNAFCKQPVEQYKVFAKENGFDEDPYTDTVNGVAVMKENGNVLIGKEV